MAFSIVQIAALGGVGILLVLTAGWAFNRYIQHDEEPEPEGTERVDRSTEGPQDDRIPVTRQHRQLSPAMKILTIAGLALVSILGFYTYQFLQAGNPVEVKFLRELQIVTGAAVLVLVGARWHASRMRNFGVVHVEYEAPGTDETTGTEEIYFRPESMERTDDGVPVVRELFSSAILGMFRRRKLAGHIPQLRGHRPLSDFVRHELRPVDDMVVLDAERPEYLMRTQGRVRVKDPNRAADFRYQPARQIPFEAHVERRREMDQMQTELEAERARRAEAERQARDLARRLENAEWEEQEQIIEQLQELRSLLAPNQHDLYFQQGTPMQRYGPHASGRPQAQRQDGEAPSSQREAGERLSQDGQGGR